MGIVTPELGSDRFLAAHRTERARRAEQRRLIKAQALAALHRARDAFCDQSAGLRAGGAGAAARDGDLLEHLADRLLEWVAELEPQLERLDPARDQTVYRGPILTRSRPPLDAGALAEQVAEAIGQAALSAQAQAVLVAAVRYAAS